MNSFKQPDKGTSYGVCFQGKGTVSEMVNLKQVPQYVWFGLLLSVQLISSTTVDLCPPQEDINPCYCVSGGKNIRTDCLSVNSLTTLRQAMRGLQGYSDVSVELMRCRLPEIPQDLFSGLHLMKLSFTQCTISEKNELYFQGLDRSLQDLTVSFSFPEENGLTLLKTDNLHKLTELVIEGNYIKTLGNDWFRNGPRNLQYLYIITNDIEEIGNEAFSSLVSLKDLWITGNKFSTIRRSMFPRPAAHLLTLDLGDNKISEIPADMFTEMPSLKDVTFSGNELKSLPGAVWSEVWKQLTSVYINGNPLHCNDSLKWMLRMPRPYLLKGQCVSPPNLKGTELRIVIDEARKDLE